MSERLSGHVCRFTLTFPSFPTQVATKLDEWSGDEAPGSATSYGPPLARCARDTSAAGTSTKNGAFKMCMLITDGANGDNTRGSKCIKPPCQDTAFQDKMGTSNTTQVWNETNVEGRDVAVADFVLMCGPSHRIPGIPIPHPHPHPLPTAEYSTHTYYSSTCISSFPAHLRSYWGERWHIRQR